MKQDIKFNGWVLISSIFQVIASVACIVAGAILVFMGLFNTAKLLGIKELNFFINQDGIIKLQNKLIGGVLLDKYMFLILGILVAVIGIVCLVFAIVELLYVKRYKVVNHRIALIAFSIIPLLIAGCAEAYLLAEYDILKSSLDYIKNIRIACFAVCGIFSACAILKLLGVLLGKSEEFVSSDNSKYAFEGTKQGKMSQGGKPVARVPARAQVQVNQSQPVKPRNMQNPNARPQQVGQARPNNIRQPISPNQPRPNNMAGSRGGSQPVRPMTRPGTTQAQANPKSPARPVQNSAPTRPIASPSNQAGQTQPTQNRRCPKCGKTLKPNEIVCSACSKNTNK